MNDIYVKYRGKTISTKSFIVLMESNKKRKNLKDDKMALAAARQKLYYDYEQKSNIEGSYHALIYGSILTKKEYFHLKETDLFKKYSLYLYGYSDDGDKFIGFEYGRIYGLYDRLHYSYGTELSFTQTQVPLEIPALFQKDFPELTGNCHAIIQNVRSSHYTSGDVMHGYWINTSELNDECSDMISEIAYGASFDKKELNLCITRVGHNMMDTNSVPSEYFIGVTLKQFTPNEGDADHEKLAKQLSKTYSSLNSDLPLRDDILKVLNNIHPTLGEKCITQFPMICLIQGMCHCCT